MLFKAVALAVSKPHLLVFQTSQNLTSSVFGINKKTVIKIPKSEHIFCYYTDATEKLVVKLTFSVFSNAIPG